MLRRFSSIPALFSTAAVVATASTNPQQLRYIQKFEKPTYAAPPAAPPAEGTASSTDDFGVESCGVKPHTTRYSAKDLNKTRTTIGRKGSSVWEETVSTSNESGRGGFFSFWSQAQKAPEDGASIEGDVFRRPYNHDEQSAAADKATDPKAFKENSMRKAGDRSEPDVSTVGSATPATGGDHKAQ